jgi:hypothetical protein
VKIEKICRVNKRDWCHEIGLESLSENPHDHPQKRTVQQGDAFEDTAFKPGFEIVKF